MSRSWEHAFLISAPGNSYAHESLRTTGTSKISVLVLDDGDDDDGNLSLANSIASVPVCKQDLWLILLTL